MPATIAELKQGLASARDTLNAVFDAAASRQDEQVYEDGLQWTTRQIAVHLADADRGYNNQIMAFAEGREIIPADFDLQRYNRRITEKRAEMTMDEARVSLAESRAALVAWLDAQDEAVLDKSGRHATMNIMTIREVLELQARHERGHADDIVNALGLNV